MSEDVSFSQSKIFLESEGDCWYDRNKSVIEKQVSFCDTAVIKRALETYRSSINHVLEIGCGNGVKLADICSFFDCVGYGVDPSSNAVKNGNIKFGNNDLKLTVSTSAKLPYQDNFFDLVHFGFCLYVVDRDEIFKTISEADRVLKKGGFLTIVDFDPVQRHKRAYDHKAGVFSYKTSYSDFFTVSGHYFLVHKESFSHKNNHFTTESDDRLSVCVLYKEVDAY